MKIYENQIVILFMYLSVFYFVLFSLLFVYVVSLFSIVTFMLFVICNEQNVHYTPLMKTYLCGTNHLCRICFFDPCNCMTKDDLSLRFSANSRPLKLFHGLVQSIFALAIVLHFCGPLPV